MLSRSLLLFVGVVVGVIAIARGAEAQPPAPGGFIEHSNDTNVRPVMTPGDVPGFPSRGAFTFPAPYHTRAVRLTNADEIAEEADCGRGPGVDRPERIGRRQ
jgi:hypothetical protein